MNREGQDNGCLAVKKKVGSFGHSLSSFHYTSHSLFCVNRPGPGSNRPRRASRRAIFSIIEYFIDRTKPNLLAQ